MSTPIRVRRERCRWGFPTPCKPRSTLQRRPLTPALSLRERGPTEVSCAMHRPDRSRRLWVRPQCLAVLDSQPLLHIGAHRQYPPIGPFPCGRGSRPRCLGECVDLTDRVDYGFIRNAWRSWIHRRYCTSASIANIPQSVPFPAGEGTLCIDLTDRVDDGFIRNAWLSWIHCRYCTSASIANIPQSVPSPGGEG